MSEGELLAHLSALSQATPIVLQPKVRDHPITAQLSFGALCTVRVVTCRPPGGPPGVIASLFRMPVEHAFVDEMPSA